MFEIIASLLSFIILLGTFLVTTTLGAAVVVGGGALIAYSIGAVYERLSKAFKSLHSSL